MEGALTVFFTIFGPTYYLHIFMVSGKSNVHGDVTPEDKKKRKWNTSKLQWFTVSLTTKYTTDNFIDP
jgi:hypothetical protein